MTRVTYASGELDPNHQIVEGIRSALAASHAKRARTTIQAIKMIDLDEEGGEQSVDRKITHNCTTLDCVHEWVGDEIIFRR